jgi:outer membrane beta-barrel protein
MVVFMDRILKNFFLALLFFSLLGLTPSFAEDKKEDQKEGSFSIEGIEVIQHRMFQKKNRHELGFSFGILYDNPFVFYEMLPVHYTYHFRESVAFEGTATFAFGQEKGLVESLRQPPIGADVKVERIKRFYTGNFLWSPIYGKFNIFASKIFHFDFFLTTGFGYMQNKVTVENTNTNHFTFNVGAGIKFYLNEWFIVRVDFKNFTWKEGEPFNDTTNSRLLSVGCGFFFPTHNKGEK